MFCFTRFGGDVGFSSAFFLFVGIYAEKLEVFEGSWKERCVF